MTLDRARAGHGAGARRAPARGRRGGRRRGRAREGGVPGLARRRARRPGEAAAPPRRRAGGRAGGAWPARGAQRRQADRRRARRDGHGGRHLPLLRGRAGARARRHDPGGRRRGDDLPRAARRRRADHAVELPADDRRLEARARAGGRQHRRAQARGADAADRAASSSGSRSRPACPRAWSTSSSGPGRTCGQRLVEHPDVAKVAFTGSTEVGRSIAAGAAQTIKRVTLELGGKSANVVFADADLVRRGGGRRRAPCSATPARTAARARASWSSARRSTRSWTRWRSTSRRSASATRSTRRRRWAR